MPASALDISRYRCFRDTAKLEMSRLTLVYGKNSSGKSALVRLPKLLAASLEAGVGLDLGHLAVGGAAFKELVWDHGSDLLRVGFVDTGGHTWAWELEWWEASDDPVVRHLEVPNDGTAHKFTWTPASRQENGEYGTYKDTNGAQISIRWEGLFPRIEGMNVDTSPLEQLRDSVIWLTTSRVPPAREGQRRGLRPLEEPHGGGWTEGLAIRDEALRERVSSWYRLNTGNELVLDELEQHLRLKLQPSRRAAPPRPFTDVGEGLQQVFPVLVALERLRDAGGLLCVEEPEAHLHPSLQRALAERIVEVLEQQPQAKVLIETHSEVFLFEALLHAVGRLRDQVSLSWVQSGPEQGATVQPIYLDEQGRPVSEALRQSFKDLGILRREVIKARRLHAG